MSGSAAVYLAATSDGQENKPGLAEMAELVESEARRIEAVQAGLVDTGALDHPDPQQVRRLVVWDAIGRLLDQYRRFEPQIRSTLEQLQKRGRPHP